MGKIKVGDGLVRVLGLAVLCSLQLACSSSAVVENPPPTSILKVEDVRPEDKIQVSKPNSHARPKQRASENIEDIEASPTSTVQIFGNSSLRKFSSNATQLGLRIKVEPPLKKPEDLLSAKLSEFVLVVPISGLKSGTALLDEHMAEALKAKTYPQIRGVVKGYENKGKNSDGSYKVEATVDLTIAGQTKTVPIDAILFIEGMNVRIKGEKNLLMTDFGVDPPTLMLGTIKTSNDITIRFNFLLGLKPEKRGPHEN